VKRLRVPVLVGVDEGQCEGVRDAGEDREAEGECELIEQARSAEARRGESVPQEKKKWNIQKKINIINY